MQWTTLKKALLFPAFRDEDRDLRVISVHENERVELIISSNALCLGSPVGKKFIFPSFEKVSSEENGDGGELVEEQDQEQGKAKRARHGDEGKVKESISATMTGSRLSFCFG